MSIPQLLYEAIISNSISDTWANAVKEWSVANIDFSDDADTCTCGHYPIKEVCCIRNTLTKARLDVGNHCVRHFLDIDMGTAFANLRRVKADISKAITKNLLDLAYTHCWINDWEYAFCLNTAKLRSMTEKQLLCREKINKKIMDRIGRE